MQPRPPRDRELLIPIAIGVISILGVGWIFLANYHKESPSLPTAVATTGIPSDLSSLRARMLTLFPAATPVLEEIPSAVTEPPLDSYPGPPAETLPSASTLTTESLPTLSATPTSDKFQPLPAGKYDDSDPNIAYDRYWTILKNPGTKNAYKGALHFSTSVGNEASFRFTGQRVYLGYQRGRNFGTVTVMIDNQTYSFHEEAFDLIWRSPQLSPGTHSVKIIHASGESINLDYIEVRD